MQIGLRLLRYVEAAAQRGNVSAAARQLRVSQSSVSAAIAELEAIVGVPIFVRHHARGVTLTRAGELLMNDTRQLLKHARDFEEKAKSLASGETGEVAAGCFVTLAVRFMPKLLASFSQACPGIAVSLEEGDQDEIVRMMLSGRIELALSYHSALRNEIASRFLGELPPHILLPADHALANRDRISLREMANERFILLDLPFSRDYFLGLFRAVGVEPNIVFRSRSHEFIRGLVAHGHGFTIHNAVTKRALAHDGTPLAVVPVAEDLPGSRIMCLRLRQNPLRPAVQALESFIVEAFSPGGLFGNDVKVRPNDNQATGPKS
jgi:DNA-binding transcriptional LysR family regulator